MINFMLLLLFWSASDCKQSLKLNSSDVSFVTAILLNGLKPSLAVTLLISAPKRHNLVTAFATNTFRSHSANAYNKLAKQSKYIAKLYADNNKITASDGD